MHLASCRLYGFIDTAYLAGRQPGAVAKELIAGGVDIIQVRAKELSHAQRVELARAVVNAAQDVPVIVNDDIAAARETGAAGVHLGQEDFAGLTRDRLKDLRIVGISTHSLAQARQAERDGADYIGVGPVFATGTKPGVKPVGLELVKAVTGQIAIPFFAIGGITLQNLDAVLAAGATRIAVVSAILNGADVAAAAKNFKEKLPV
ncbi:MAG: thiamine phosphate synthase [Verrucomicrobiota bacterium]|jgi:thiamine-phosphate pyrophosphorylase